MYRSEFIWESEDVPQCRPLETPTTSTCAQLNLDFDFTNPHGGTVEDNPPVAAFSPIVNAELAAIPGASEFLAATKSHAVVFVRSANQDVAPVVVQGRENDGLQGVFELTCPCFARELDRLELLIERDVRMLAFDGTSFQMEGIWIVDQARLNTLSDAKLLHLARLGYLTLITAHLLSLSRQRLLLQKPRMEEVQCT